jgi:uncharacterized protein (TIGR02246 family)
MSSPPAVRDERAVHALVEAVSSAWAGGDAAAFADYYAEEATAILPGFYLPDKEAIGTSMAAAFAGPLNGSRRIHRVQSVRFPGEGTAIVISRSATAFRGETEPAPDRWSLATWLLSRRDGRWLVEAYHDCPAGAR